LPSQARLAPWTRWSLTILIVVAVMLPVLASADDSVGVSSTTTVEAPEMGIVTVFGPRVSASGPPTAFKLEAQFWTLMVDSLAFHAATGMTISGETQFDSSDPLIDDARYSSTVGGNFEVGVKWFLDFLDWPVDTWLRGALAVEVTGGEQLIGYSFGPTVGGGVS